MTGNELVSGLEKLGLIGFGSSSRGGVSNLNAPRDRLVWAIDLLMTAQPLTTIAPETGGAEAEEAK